MMNAKERTARLASMLTTLAETGGCAAAREDQFYEWAKAQIQAA